jgi:hypothetical protein
MEDLREQYARPSDPRRPLLCDGERPCQPLGDVLVPLPLEPGQPRRSEYEYERHGTCCVRLAVEPPAGLRDVQVRARRTAVDYAHFLPEPVQRHYPRVERGRLGQDNLDTHTPGSFYQVWPPAQAFAVAQRCELHYPPLKGRWLNMAGIELAGLANQCLDRRIPDQAT